MFLLKLLIAVLSDCLDANPTGDLEKRVAALEAQESKSAPYVLRITPTDTSSMFIPVPSDYPYPQTPHVAPADYLWPTITNAAPADYPDPPQTTMQPCADRWVKEAINSLTL